MSFLKNLTASSFLILSLFVGTFFIANTQTIFADQVTDTATVYVYYAPPAGYHWSAWSPTTCSAGVTRTRTCQNASNVNVANSFCNQIEGGIDTDVCVTPPTAVNCAGSCSAPSSCGTYNITTQASNGGSACPMVQGQQCGSTCGQQPPTTCNPPDILFNNVCIDITYDSDGDAVAPAGMLGALNPATYTCTIPAGESTCPINMSWYTNNPTDIYNTDPALGNGTSSIRSRWTNGADDFNPYGSGDFGDRPFPVRYGANTFKLWHSYIVLDKDIVNGVCANGANWNGSSCGSNGCPSGQVLINGVCTTQCVAPNVLVGGVCMPPEGGNTLTVGDCSIPNGGDTCDLPVSWSIGNPGGSTGGVNGLSSGCNFSGNSGSGGCARTPGTYNFQLQLGGTGLATDTGTASCASGTSWLNGTCQIINADSLNIGDCTIPNGASTCNLTMNWLIGNPGGSTGGVNSLGNGCDRSGNFGNGPDCVKGPGTYNFQLQLGAQGLLSDTGTASCAGNLEWRDGACRGNLNGTINATSCVVGSGGNSCLSHVSYNLSNYGYSNAFIKFNDGTTNMEGPASGGSWDYPITVKNDGSGHKFAVWGEYVTEVAVTYATASCGENLSWVPGSNACLPGGGPDGRLIITPNPCYIKQGESSCTALTTWEAWFLGPYGTSSLRKTSASPTPNLFVRPPQFTGYNFVDIPTILPYQSYPYQFQGWYRYENPGPPIVVNESIMKTAEVTVLCENSVWNGTMCAPTTNILEAFGCTINVGASSCTPPNVRWYDINATGTTTVVKDVPAANTPVGSGKSSPAGGVSQTLTVTHDGPNAIFYKLINSVSGTLLTKLAIVSCDGTWSTTLNICEDITGSVTLTADKTQIIKGSSVKLTFIPVGVKNCVMISSPVDQNFANVRSAMEAPGKSFFPQETTDYSVRCTPNKVGQPDITTPVVRVIVKEVIDTVER